MDEFVEYRLSSIDQSQPRDYLRCCLGFKCTQTPKEAQQTYEAFQKTIRNVVSRMPVLAGVVCGVEASLNHGPRTSPSRSNPHNDRLHQAHAPSLSTVTLDTESSGHSVSRHDRKSTAIEQSLIPDPNEGSDASLTVGEQIGRVRVLVNAHQVQHFGPTYACLGEADFPDNFRKFDVEATPCSHVLGEMLTPPLDICSSDLGKQNEEQPVFAVKVFFTEGGLIAVFYLHQAVGDIADLGRIITLASTFDTNALNFPTAQALVLLAAIQNSMRNRASMTTSITSAQGHPEFSCWDVSHKSPDKSLAVRGKSGTLSILTSALDTVRDFANDRNLHMYDCERQKVSSFDCLLAVLWMAAARTQTWAASDQLAKVFVPVSWRPQEKLIDTADEIFLGNSSLNVMTTYPVPRLLAPIEPGNITRVAWAIRDQIHKVNERRLQSTINFINEQEDVRVTHAISSMHVNDIVVTDWRELPADEEASLNLGLGRPVWISKAAPQMTRSSFTVLPSRRQGVCEVLVEDAGSGLSNIIQEKILSQFSDQLV